MICSVYIIIPGLWAELTKLRDGSCFIRVLGVHQKEEAQGLDSQGRGNHNDWFLEG